ncbi:hypothetical protein A2783_01995 [Microgenomates group bacterium RIFCSPHIGHO2_01_FULL_45_11]|nr:MAG: hypothetical protein A2783_01995 [Microgenomates group bacterium RIFCSPHIGHO2_01_FULL_45_11]
MKLSSLKSSTLPFSLSRRVTLPAFRSLGEGGSLSKGFTLIEMLIVMAMIGVLLAIATVSYRTTRIRAQNARREADIQQVRTALEIYRSDNGTYPNVSVSGNMQTAVGATYLTNSVQDPVGGTYVYTYGCPASGCAAGTCTTAGREYGISYLPATLAGPGTRVCLGEP